MKFGTSIIIFFLALIALIAEFILYFIFGIGAVFSGDINTLSGGALIIVSLMGLTVATGVLAPICALIELIVKKKNVGVYTMVTILGIIMAYLIIINVQGLETLSEVEEASESKLLETTEVIPTETLIKDQEIKIEKPKKENRGFYEKKAYIKNIELYELEAKYHKTYEGKIPGVVFKLKNKGDRTLTKVEVTVYFKDASGTIIYEEIYHPILVTKYSFTGDNKPLKPNYIWQMERGRYLMAESVPSEWKEGAVSAKITNIEFEE